jgi:hypothetical protein
MRVKLDRELGKQKNGVSQRIDRWQNLEEKKGMASLI